MIHKPLPALLRLTVILLLAASIPAPAQQPAPPNPGDPALRVNPGSDYFLRGKNLYDAARRSNNHAQKVAGYERAIPLLSDYLTRFGNHANAAAAWYYLGQCYYNTGRIHEASRCFHTVLRRFGKGPYAAAAASALAVDHYTRKEYALAAELFQTSAANAPRAQDQQRAYYYRAMSLHHLKRNREAVAAYQKVIKLEPHGSRAFTNRARLAVAHLLGRSGKQKDALAAFKELVERSDQQEVRGEAALYAGITAAELGSQATSEHYLQMVLTTPGMEAWRPRAQVALMSNRYDAKKYLEVLEIFRRSSTPAEGATEGRRLMLAALANMHLGGQAKALELFRQVERTVPPTSDLAFDAAYNRLLCFYKIDGTHVDEQADAFLQIYGKARPRDARIHTARLMKAETLFNRRKFREAAESYSEIDATLVSDSNRPGLLYQRGWCLSTAGDFQGAIRSFSKFISAYPEDERVPEALAKRAEAEIKNGDRAAALRDLDQLAATNPPPKLAAFAWQKSARLCKEEGDHAEMIRRYQTLLDKVTGLDAEVVANASYWIGWGHFKTDNLEEAVKWLREARKLDAKTYGNQAGLMLTLALFSLQDVDGLATEIDSAIVGGYVDQVPEQAIRWVGIQVFNAGRHIDAALFLKLAANPDDPRQTPKVVWRYLGKAQLETGEAEEALIAVDHVLEVEDQPVWIADALLDKSRALRLLGRAQEALDAGNDGLAMRPQGRIGSGMRLAVGDAEFDIGNYDGAIKHYAYVVEFVEDKELQPKALQGLIQALEKKGDATEAARYRKILREKFPDHKPAKTTPKPRPTPQPAPQPGSPAPPKTITPGG